MSHITIIIKTRPTGTSIAADEHGVSSELQYTPSDGLTHQQVGDNVGKLIKKLEKLEQPDAD